MSNHTPGPWRVDRVFVNGEHVLGVVDSDGDEICNVGNSLLADAFNVEVIALAPDMLDMLKCVSECSGRGGMFDASKCMALISEIRALIKRAEGV